MKRLLSRVDSDLFQLCRCFRRGERGRLHLEEFTMLEWYRKGADYQQLMQDCFELLNFLQLHLKESSRLPTSTGSALFWQLDLSFPWQRLTVTEAFSRFAPMSVDEALAQDIFDETLVEFVEPMLGRGKPAFLVDYPSSMASLAKRKDTDPSVAERFELYVEGIELANGFSELTDVEEQRTRFTEEIRLIENSSGQRHTMPEKFLEDLNTLDQAAGIALGIDRLFMMVGGYDRISDAVTFSPDDFA